MLEKLADAGSMFWQALDERERIFVLYALCYLGVLVLSALQSRSRERLKQELREELRASA